MEVERERWNRISWSRDNALDFDKIMGEYCVKTILDNKKGTTLLDIGCGVGTLTVKFEKYFQSIVGIDASKNHLEIARKTYANKKNISFIQSLIEDYSPKEKFDTISMINLLEHVNEPVSILKRISNWLSPEGIIIIIVPNALTPTRRIAKEMKILKDEYELTEWDVNVAGHRRVYDLNLLKTDIERTNLRMVNSGGIFFKTVTSPQIEYLLDSNLWNSYNYGWGGNDIGVNWRKQYCNGCYEVGKLFPNECVNIFIVASNRISKR